VLEEPGCFVSIPSGSSLTPELGCAAATPNVRNKKVQLNWPAFIPCTLVRLRRQASIFRFPRVWPHHADAQSMNQQRAGGSLDSNVVSLANARNFLRFQQGHI
jgi:hypothetical protein